MPMHAADTKNEYASFLDADGLCLYNGAGDIWKGTQYAMQYVIGVDFGTQSARAIVTRICDGKTLGEAVYAYPGGVMDSRLADGTILSGGDWALADPGDYLEALIRTVRGARAQAGVDARQVGALAIAATACTLMPVDEHLQPLCGRACFRSRPHAYAKLWKHHRAQPWADRLTKAAEKMQLPMLDDYGGRISPEWALPKVMEVYDCDREVYEAADRFMQFSDWLTALLTGDADVQNGSIAIYKAMWSPQEGDVDDAYLDFVGEPLRQIVHEKLRGHKLLAGECAGHLTEKMAKMLDLAPGTVVGMAHTDAHAAALGGGAAEDGDYVYILGSSSCGHLLAREKKKVWRDRGAAGRADPRLYLLFGGAVLRGGYAGVVCPPCAAGGNFPGGAAARDRGASAAVRAGRKAPSRRKRADCAGLVGRQPFAAGKRIAERHAAGADHEYVTLRYLPRAAGEHRFWTQGDSGSV